jgi:hypothetical protein
MKGAPHVFNKKDIKTQSVFVAMFVNGSVRNEQSLYRTFHRCFLPSFGSFGQVVSEEKIFKNRPMRPDRLTNMATTGNSYF